ncbi:MAG: hypothetical protein IPH75_16080 [bacterium]|nr:hypothetical protein [bacterium]
MIITHKFVEKIPDKLDEKVLYVSSKYGTAVHKCFCGCGEEVVTPLSPTDWKLSFNGKTVSLYPSIGNWSLKCQSHYWIKNGRVVWVPKWTPDKIRSGRAQDARIKDAYYRENRGESQPVTQRVTLWQKIIRWFG